MTKWALHIYIHVIAWTKKKRHFVEWQIVIYFQRLISNAELFDLYKDRMFDIF